MPPEPLGSTPALSLHHCSISEAEKSPFQLLSGEVTMTGLGLEPGFAQSLLQLDRDSPPLIDDVHPSRLRMIPQQKAVEALAAFSASVHPWYPVFRPGFSAWYLATISGPLRPSCDSGLALLVAAVGLLVADESITGQAPGDHPALQFFEAAMASLPAMISSNTVSAIHCLLLLATYASCALRPCQAYEYLIIASFKVQNLLKAAGSTNDELRERLNRSFWAILLFESEIRVQFELVDSGIRELDDEVPLPDSRRTWRFNKDCGTLVDGPSPDPALESPVSDATDSVQSYFLAEIAMRRMLNRCNTAIRRTSDGHIVYAPGIATELEGQLESWYSYLPFPVRFDCHHDLDFDLLASPSLPPNGYKLSNFLRVQYYCCKISIYWPASYQCVKDDGILEELVHHCAKFFDAYIQLMPSILMSVRDCQVNRWTLYASIFMTSLSVIRAASVSGMRQACDVDWARLTQCLQATQTVDRAIAEATPSLSMLSGTLSRHVAAFMASMGPTQAEIGHDEP